MWFCAVACCCVERLLVDLLDGHRGVVGLQSGATWDPPIGHLRCIFSCSWTKGPLSPSGEPESTKQTPWPHQFTPAPQDTKRSTSQNQRSDSAQGPVYDNFSWGQVGVVVMPLGWDPSIGRRMYASIGKCISLVYRPPAAFSPRNAGVLTTDH